MMCERVKGLFDGQVMLVFFFLSLGLCLADQGTSSSPYSTFMKNATEAPEEDYFDYIIVGGGTAGCPLAATLSQSFRVLLLERGGSPYGNTNISNLIHFSDTLSNLAPDSPSQRFISTDGVINARARILGGGTCLNAGFYTHAEPAFVRAAGWDGALVNQSYAWVERTIVRRPVVRQWQKAVMDGLLEAGVTPSNGFTFEHIPGTKVGGSTFDSQGNRHTAADLLSHANPSMLSVFLSATVNAVIFDLTGSNPNRYSHLGIRQLLNISAGIRMNLRPRHANVSTSLEQYCRDTVQTIWHYHGGAVVGRVVDRNYRVIGISGLRVIDGSTFSESPGTNPQATVMMLGRYMGMKILQERSNETASSHVTGGH